MNLFIRISLIIVLGAVCQMYLPWWTGVLVAFVVEAIIGKGNSTAFFSGFYGLALPWMALATYIDLQNDSVLSFMILDLFKLPKFSFVMIVVTGLVGGLVGGIGSFAGGWLKKAIAKNGE